MIDLTQYEAELLWLKDKPKIYYIDPDKFIKVTDFGDGDQLHMNCSGPAYGKVVLVTGQSPSNVRCSMPYPHNDNVNYRQLLLNSKFKIKATKNLIYLELFGTKRKDDKKYKFDSNWKPLCEIPDELEEQLTYLKMAGII